MTEAIGIRRRTRTSDATSPATHQHDQPQLATTMPTRHYTPPLDRFLVKALYHEARQRDIPMTRLANQIVQQALTGSTGWKQAEQEVATLREEATPYPTQ